ncbi:type IV pili methyl-accepting chemotaxis transducer N-terminal domain-containing protein [Uliginosibacterium paludis]|uniref:Type IV pili methyl-accepting chemotaxis transducer N-terminal domain-containing protein n=1 Tax=Uliginosibacterium paludis TaxID=1615952 RepID=A0ABV2CQG6_9RHOO
MQNEFNIRRRALVLGLGSLPLACLATAAIAAPAPLNLIEAINQAGRQRMLSQRLAKLYAQQLRGVRESDARKLTGDSMQIFETQMEALRLTALARNAPEIVATYEKMSALWSDYRAVISARPGEEGLKRVAQLNEQVLASAQQGTVQFEKLNGSSLGKLVNVAGRQRMLSQRMSKFYFFIASGMDSTDMRKGLDSARTDFVSAMQLLRAAPENTKDTQSWLKLADMQWMLFDDALMRSAKEGDHGYLESNVATSSENILQVMDKLTELYARLG